MLINKEGKIVANASQATVIFDAPEAYNTWIDAFPLPTQEAGETERQAKERVYLPRFVVIKKYEQAEENGMVIYKADLAAIKSLKENVKSGAIYVAQDTLKLYQATYTVGATEAAVQELSNDGGVSVVATLPTAANAEVGMLYVVEDTCEAYTLNTAGDALIKVADDVVNIASFDPTAVGKQANVGQIVLDVAAKKGWLCIAAGTSTAAGTYTQFLGEGAGSYPAEFWPTFAEFPSLASGIPAGYALEDRFFIEREGYKMYAMIENPESAGTYMYKEISQVIDNVDVCDFSNATRAVAAATPITATTQVTTKGVIYYMASASKFYIFNGSAAVEYTPTYFENPGSVDKIYVAKHEGILYVWDDTLATPDYIAVGGADEVQVYANKAAFPTTGQGGKLYIALDEAQCYIYNGGYVLVSDRCTVLYANKAAFPETGREGMIYIAKDTGKMYYYDSTSTATDKYIILGDSDDVIVGTKAEIEALTLQKGVLYVASDEKKTYIAIDATAPATGLVLLQVGGGETPSYTQNEWDALTDKPDLAYITDSKFDAPAYQNQ